ncbi:MULTISPECIES: RES domain-containing protein [Paraburkholderia]|uniref:RES domain-containing protein n=1 Tax=Paraburkholderia TaxID=1822464 RepID=UPI0022511665|nr:MULTISPECIES: RES domain-containing protein [Paraburkholderia]MCX4171845.1 RES domain-containing protein [Paraburkholderia madseniana]MDQ6459854.1 RES family NAD+ phosphorylase [Paraburkholderia madseniana]
MTDSVCFQCFQDKYLSAQVKTEGEPDLCRVCGKVSESITIERLGEILEPIMRDNFAPGRQVPEFDGSDHLFYSQLGDPISYWVQEVLGQYFDFEDEIVSAVIEADDYWPSHGGEPYWDDTQDYEPIDNLSGEFYQNWRETLAEVKHSKRFFSEKARALFTELFADVEHMRLATRRHSPVVRTLPVNTRLYRARVVTSAKLLKDMIADPLKNIGPPPPELARAGRMNAEGISVFYGALDAQTCMAEMRPAIGNHIAVIELKTDRRLRVLDFSRLDRARSRKALSYLQPDYKRQKERRAFLKILHALISQPVTPGREADYLVTQTMAEFLAHVASPPFDGILFQSAQRARGTNIVLFPATREEDENEPRNLSISLAKADVRLFKTEAISYSHGEQMAYFANDTDEVIYVGKGDGEDDGDF